MARALVLEGPRSLRLQDEDRRTSGRATSAFARWSAASATAPSSTSTAAAPPSPTARSTATCARSCGPTRRVRRTRPARLRARRAGSRRSATAVTELEPGDLVHAGAPHGEEAVARPRRRRPPDLPARIRLPAGEPPPWALFVSLGAVALVAAHDARIKLGDHVAVVGLGAIGLLLVQMRPPRRGGGGSPPSTRSRAAASWRSSSAPTRRSTRATRRRARARRSSAPRAAGPTWRSRRPGAPPACTTPIAAAGLGGTVVTVGFYQGGAAAAAAGRGVAPQPARHGLEHGRVGRSAPLASRRGTARA